MTRFDKRTIIDRLMETFLDEMTEHVSKLSSGLLVLENSAPPQKEYSTTIKSLFRTVHSLKGAARAVDLPFVESICHHLEDVLGYLRDSEVKPAADTLETLFVTSARLQEIAGRLRQKQKTTDLVVDELISKLKTISSTYENSQLSRPAMPASTEAELESADGAPQNGGAVKAAQVAEILPAIVNGAEDELSAGAETISSPAESSSMRIAAERLDHLLALSGEFLTSYRRTEIWQSALDDLTDRLRTQTRGVCSQASLKLLFRDAERLAERAKLENRNIGETARLLDEEIRSLRMRPFSDACLGMNLAVRDLSRSSGKLVKLKIEGGDVELDRAVLEKLKDPLLHIVRNAVYHGIEMPDERQNLHKPAEATVTMSASIFGALVQITIRDDGKGIDRKKIVAQALRQNLTEPQSKSELTDLIFSAGFSTADEIGSISGRGMGLDVVANQIAELQGSVTVDFEEGAGTTFTITVPLTLTKVRVLFVQVAGEVLAFPSSSIHRLIRFVPSELVQIEGRYMLPVEGQLVAVSNLADVLQWNQVQPCDFQNKNKPAVVVRQGTTERAFMVDELLSEQEVVVTSLGAYIKRIRNVTGATILPTGHIALILNSIELMRKNSDAQQTLAKYASSQTKSKETKRLIVADDSPTTRILESSILEAAGYDVSTASDGREAWELIQKGGADLLISDVEMPFVNGFELTKLIRGSEKWCSLPVILVTGLAKNTDRAQGMEAGASAYVVKNDFDQSELLDAIEQLI